MIHISPHRLADLAGGRATAAAASRMRLHLQGCARCRAVWERLGELRGEFRTVVETGAPDLRWDLVRAQVYWSGSSSTMIPVRSRRWWWLAAPLGMGMIVAAGWALVSGGSSPARTADPSRALGVGAPAAPQPGPLVAVPTLIEGHVTARYPATAVEVVDRARIGGAVIGEGTVLRTGVGRIGFQFGADSTVTLAPQSSLSVRRFDATAIELVVEGQVDVAVTRRAPGQRFAVIAGGRTIEVRGTAFRVRHRGADFAVACEHGRVVVSAQDAAVEVKAGEIIEDQVDARPNAGARRPLAAAELADLRAAPVPPLPVWTSPHDIFRTTGAMAFAASESGMVRLDGVAVGTGPLWVRVPAGRHMVEIERAPGTVDPPRWVKVDAASQQTVGAVEAPVKAAARPLAKATATRTVRRAELNAVLGGGRFGACVRALAKQGFASGGYVELEIGVDSNGVLRFVNLVDANLPARVSNCVRSTVASLRLTPGPASTWRHQVKF